MLHPKLADDPLTPVAPVALVASRPVILVVREASPSRTLAKRALHGPDSVERLQAEGSEAMGGTPDDFARAPEADHRRRGDAVRATGAKPD